MSRAQVLTAHARTVALAGPLTPSLSFPLHVLRNPVLHLLLPPLRPQNQNAAFTATTTTTYSLPCSPQKYLTLLCSPSPCYTCTPRTCSPPPAAPTQTHLTILLGFLTAWPGDMNAQLRQTLQVRAESMGNRNPEGRGYVCTRLSERDSTPIRTQYTMVHAVGPHCC